jgi:hypothetical protein
MVEMDFMSRKEEAEKKRFDISVLVGLASSGVLIVVLSCARAAMLPEDRNKEIKKGAAFTF